MRGGVRAQGVGLGTQRRELVAQLGPAGQRRVALRAGPLLPPGRLRGRALGLRRPLPAAAAPASAAARAAAASSAACRAAPSASVASSA